MTGLLEYLLDQEKEERNERRALEQRAAGLILALLVALPVAGNLAAQTDRDGLGFVGLIGSGLALIAALAIAARIAGQLSDKGATAGEAPSGAELREQVAVALEAGNEWNAAAAQRQLLGKLRGRNQQLADRVKAETGLLPLVLVLFLVSLALMVADPEGSAPQQRSNPSDMSVHPSR